MYSINIKISSLVFVIVTRRKIRFDQKKDKVLDFGKSTYGYQADAHLYNKKDFEILLGHSGGGETIEPGIDK